jgi:serine/threonine-protein kinase
MTLFRLLLYAAAAVLVFVLATSYTIRFLLLDEQTVTCPELTGLDVEEARTLASQKGLPLAVAKYEKRKDVAYNRVVLQKPDAGVPVRPGRTVTVILADGPMMAVIPAFVGLSLEAAKAALQQQAMKLKKAIYVPGGEPDRVLAQVPESGENILDPDGVVLIVGSRAKRFYVMPEVAPGQYAAALKEMDLKSIKHVEVSLGRPEGAGAAAVKTSVPPRAIFREDEGLELQTGGGGQRGGGQQ